MQVYMSWPSSLTDFEKPMKGSWYTATRISLSVAIASFLMPISLYKSLNAATDPALWSCMELAQFFLAVRRPDLGTPSNIRTLFLSVVPSAYVAMEFILLPSVSFNPFILKRMFHSRYFFDEVP